MSPEGARRAAELIRRDLVEVARQAEMDLRFDRIDERFVEQDRLTEARFDGLDHRFNALQKQIDGLDTRVSDLRAEVGGRMQDLKDTMEARMQDLKESVERSLADHKESTRREIRTVQWMLGFGFALLLAMFGGIIAIIVRLFF